MFTSVRNVRQSVKTGGMRRTALTKQLQRSTVSLSVGLWAQTTGRCLMVLVVGMVTLHFTEASLGGDDVAAVSSGNVVQNDEQASGVSSTRLQEIGVALNLYHDKHKQLPAAASRDDLRMPLLSWRVHILPFLNGGTELFERFKLDEPWDSPHNRQLITEMPDVFRSPTSRSPPGHTNYLGVIGDRSIFAYKTGTRKREILDGGFTLIVVEANDDMAVEWTQPSDWRVDPQRPHKGLFDDGESETLVMSVDSTRHYLSRSISNDDLLALVTMNRRDTFDRSALRAVPSPTRRDLGGNYGAELRQRDRAVRASKESMRKIGLALLDYYYANKHYPPAATRDAGDNALLSWRVLILPFLGRQDLYGRFHHDEPWDSPHNRALIGQMPEVFRSPLDESGDGKTPYIGARGENAVFPLTGRRTMREIEDGLSHTVMVFQTDEDHMVVWPRPQDDHQPPLRPKGIADGRLGRNLLTVHADGSVHGFSSNIRVMSFEGFVDINNIRNNPRGTQAHFRRVDAELRFDRDRSIQSIVLRRGLSQAGELPRLFELDGLDNVTSVQLVGKQFDDRSLRVLVSLPKLSTVMLHHTSITPQGASVLDNCPGLSVAHLTGDNVGDEFIKRIARLPKLQRLELDETAVTDDALTHFANSISMTELDVQNADIGDAALAAIAKMPVLQSVKLGETSVTADGLAQLRRQRPQLEIFANVARQVGKYRTFRTVFVPQPGTKNKTQWTPIFDQSFGDGEPVYTMGAAVTLGGRFPVTRIDEKRPEHRIELFSVEMIEGNDDGLQLGVMTPGGEEYPVELARDKPAEIEVDGETYTLSFANRVVRHTEAIDTSVAELQITWQPKRAKSIDDER